MAAAASVAHMTVMIFIDSASSAGEARHYLSLVNEQDSPIDLHVNVCVIVIIAIISAVSVCALQGEILGACSAWPWCRESGRFM